MLSQIFDINKALANSKLLKVWEDVFGWLSFFFYLFQVEILKNIVIPRFCCLRRRAKTEDRH